MHKLAQSEESGTSKIVTKTVTTVTAAKKTWINVVGTTNPAGGDPSIHLCFNDFHDIAWLKRFEGSDAVL